ncbi:MAG: hypothetical protein EOP48_09085 [Sphingobacteriales bacterium]|nr:MAG: hypothetical protein EOP48_09085 [Sphingobacteriales bacterium]
MSRKSILISLTVIALIALLAYFYIGTKQKGGNKIRVTVDNSLSVDKVIIEKGFYSINSGSDQNLVKIGLGKIVFFQKPNDGFETICGENDFYVIYDNVFYAIVRHFIPNDFYDGIPKPHTYNFKLYKQADTIKMTVDIVGQDGEKFETKLAHVSNANENLWGQPIQSSSNSIDTVDRRTNR